MKRERLNQLLERMATRKAVLIGDMCLDVYWFADMTRSVLSRETPHFPLPVVSERMSAGAGGNAVANMATLCENVIPIGVLGDDWRGDCLRRIFQDAGMYTGGLITVEGRTTNAYCKPMRRGYLGFDVEDPRIDFESFESLSEDAELRVIDQLDQWTADADVLCVSDQFAFGCVTDRVRQRINELASGGLLTVVDSRSRIASYRNCILKPNEIECARALGMKDDALNEQNSDAILLERAICALAETTASDVCLTLGGRGSLILKDSKMTRVPAVKVEPPLDTVGAGDCFLSAFSLAMASGATPAEAGEIGSLASAVCVKKLNTTGTASREEILARYREE